MYTLAHIHLRAYIYMYKYTPPPSPTHTPQDIYIHVQIHPSPLSHTYTYMYTCIQIPPTHTHLLGELHVSNGLEGLVVVPELRVQTDQSDEAKVAQVLIEGVAPKLVCNGAWGIASIVRLELCGEEAIERLAVS